ncbi:DUF166 domain-containing protein [Methanolobus halotolerans]|uniref:Thymidylate synthase n=1 Tax=Methanolobus halotolerans TaxID=2052935 RepID=A0A4E0PY06_9EURY|nr:DUF166 domain-containing protein [Methanolobus halotolerans]TGC09720.1 hypothetical protein CUN85_04990 [Methanolobus halotolerans]
MSTIGVITRGKYGKRLIGTIVSRTGLDVVSAALPESIPDFIDEPEVFLEEIDLENTVFRSDILITYSLHPDLTMAIAQKAGKEGVRSLIVPGGAAKAPVIELDQIAKQYGMYIEIEEICCTLSDNPAISDFTSKLARPVLEIDTDGNRISAVRVIRGAPCGSTWHMAEKLIGTKIEEAPSRAGLLIQQYPCRAARGTLGGIHKSADIHKETVEEAIRAQRAKDS